MAYGTKTDPDGTIRVAVSAKLENDTGTTPPPSPGAGGVWKWEKWTSNQSYNTSYTDVFTVSSPGAVIYGVVFRVSSTSTTLRGLVDGNTVLDIHLKNDLGDLALDNNSSSGSSFHCDAPWVREYASRRYVWEAPEPILITTDFKIQLKADSGNKTAYTGWTIWRQP